MSKALLTNYGDILDPVNASNAGHHTQAPRMELGSFMHGYQSTMQYLEASGSNVSTWIAEQMAVQIGIDGLNLGALQPGFWPLRRNWFEYTAPFKQGRIQAINEWLNRGR